METIRIMVVAADPLARAGLVGLLTPEATVAVVAQRSPADLEAEIDEPPFDLVIWDVGWDSGIGLPDLGVFGVPVLVLIAEDEEAAEALAAGALGVLPRDGEALSLVAAIQALAAGLFVMAPTLQPATWRRQPGAEAAALAELTGREHEVLGHVAEGMTNKAIAQALDISEHTVKFHVNSIMTKLGAQSRTEAVVLATRQGLLSL